MKFRMFLATCMLCLGIASAQSFRLGAVLSLSGAAERIGQAQATALDVLETEMRYDQGTFGIPLDISVADDGSSAVRAVQEASRLIDEEGVHALLCCSTEAATRAVATVAERAGVLMLALSAVAPRPEATPRYWVFSVPPGDATIVQRMVLDIAAQGEHSLALMALDNSYGQTAKDALDVLLGPGGPTLTAEERYPPGVRVLTPEALLVATSQPGGVIVWGLDYDSTLAYESLRDRGYEGPVYLDPHLLSPLGRRPDFGRLQGALLPVSPIRADDLPSDFRGYDEARRFLGHTARFRLGERAIYGAYAWDALLLLRSSLALTLTYGLELQDLNVMRQALRDSLVGMGPLQGAAAVYDYEEDTQDGVLPSSLVVVRVNGSRLTALR